VGPNVQLRQALVEAWSGRTAEKAGWARRVAVGPLRLGLFYSFFFLLANPNLNSNLLRNTVQNLCSNPIVNLRSANLDNIKFIYVLYTLFSQISKF
jgi:hypothetical protein